MRHTLDELRGVRADEKGCGRVKQAVTVPLEK